MIFDAFLGPSYSFPALSIDCQRTVNFTLELVESQHGKSRFSLRRSPGLYLFADTGLAAPIRGLFAQNGRCYLVVAGTVMELFGDGTTGARGTVTDDGQPAFMAGNPSQIMIASGRNGYILEDTTLTQ